MGPGLPDRWRTTPYADSAFRDFPPQEQLPPSAGTHAPIGSPVRLRQEEVRALHVLLH